MAAKKKHPASGYQELYVYMTNVEEKRKHILLGIKNSLLMQQEYENVMEIRKNKSLVTHEIKSSLTDINKYYRDLNKSLPNVKNILSYTEKEINELERQINSLQVDTETNKQNIELDKGLKMKLKGSKPEINQVKATQIKKKIQKTHITQEKINNNPKIIPVTTQAKLSKLDRIQNNLRVIESKLKNI